ncbi:MAG: hypothetical protein R3D63_12930 [Paracoccaceae bacterium]
MLVKVILIFLLAMVLVGMLGKLLFPGAAGRITRRKGKYCADCGRPLIGKTCSCGGKS